MWHRRGVDIASLQHALADGGLDLAHVFAPRAIAREVGAWIDDAARPLGILVGNTRAMWPRFAASFDRDASDPVDRYVERVITDATHALDASVQYAHAQYEGAYRPFQRLAEAAGLAARSPAQLLIHPELGPWFAVRAVILLPGIAPVPPPRVALPCACDAAGCAERFAAASARPDDWRGWLAVRDACPVGRAYRYDDDQLAYHYTKDRRFLPVR